MGVKQNHHKLTRETVLPRREAIMNSNSTKKELIYQLCINRTPDNITMVGEEQCLFGHEEADVNILSYTDMLVKRGKRNIQINADDNDIFILLMCFVWKWQIPDLCIQMKKFDGSLIDINNSVSDLGAACGNLLAAHALTGCDTVSYPFNRGKSSAITTFKKHTDLKLEVFGEPTEAGLSFTSYCKCLAAKICQNIFTEDVQPELSSKDENIADDAN